MFQALLIDAYNRVARVRRRTAWTTAALVCAMLILGVPLFAKDAGSVTAATSQWLTLPNVLAVAVLIFHFGSLRQELTEIRTAQADVKKWRDETVPATYVRRDVFEAEMHRAERGR